MGKTELAKALAEFLFGSEEALISFDMSEFMEKHTVSKLVGAPPGYVGYDEGGELTKAVRRRPYSVVLFDEVEKAHPDVFNVLLQILEEGRLTDGQGRHVDFSNTVIIMTSNIGARHRADHHHGLLGPGASGPSDKEITSRVMTELKKHFRPEFLNRVDEVVVFKSLTPEQLRGIVELMVADLRDRLVAQGMSIELTDAARDLVAKEGAGPGLRARPLRRAIQTLIEDPLSRSSCRASGTAARSFAWTRRTVRSSLSTPPGDSAAPPRAMVSPDFAPAEPSRGVAGAGGQLSVGSSPWSPRPGRGFRRYTQTSTADAREGRT